LALLAKESGCDLHTKIINAQNAGFKSLVIMSEAEKPTVMEINEKNKPKYEINVAFVGSTDGLTLQGLLNSTTRYFFVTLATIV